MNEARRAEMHAAWMGELHFPRVDAYFRDLERGPEARRPRGGSHGPRRSSLLITMLDFVEKVRSTKGEFSTPWAFEYATIHARNHVPTALGFGMWLRHHEKELGIETRLKERSYVRIDGTRTTRTERVWIVKGWGGLSDGPPLS